MAAEHHSVAAVLSPRTLNPSLKDEARAQEPNAGNDLGRDARWAYLAGEQRAKHHEGGRTERDERIGPEPGQALAPLALKANGCSEQQPNHKVER